MTFNFFKFFGPRYFFSLRTTISHEALVTLLVVFGILFLAGITLKVIRQRQDGHHLRDLLNRYANCLAVMGGVGLVLAWLRYETTFFFSGRFFLVLWLAGLVYWLQKIIRYQRRLKTQVQGSIEKKDTFYKYLPRKKK